MVAKVMSLARGQFFYGWVIVAVGFAAQCMVAGIQGYGIGLFLKPMSEELGWGRAVISGVQSFGTLVSGLVSPFLGPIIDKRGGRGLMIVGGIIAGAGFAALSLVHGIWDFYLIRGIIVTIGISGAGSLAVNVAISNWFIRKRGKAVAIGAMGVSFGGVVIPPFATYLIATYGWRIAWVILGITLWVVIIPPVALFMKRRPEDLGLLPDGDSPLPAGLAKSMNSTASRNVPGEENWTRAEAVRTPALWLTIFAFGFGSMGMGAMLMHLYPYLTDIGLTAAAAAAGVSVEALAAFVSKPLWGALIDRYHVRPCGVAAFALCALGIAVLGLLSAWPALWLVYFATTLYGLAMGGQIPIQEVLWANYFGRLSLGAVRSLASPFSIIFSAGGPFFTGWAYDVFKSYQLAFAIFTITYALAAILVFLGRPPKKSPKKDIAAAYPTLG